MRSHSNLEVLVMGQGRSIEGVVKRSLTCLERVMRSRVDFFFFFMKRFIYGTRCRLRNGDDLHIDIHGRAT